MKVRRLRWERYRIPLRVDFTTAHGRTVFREGLILRLETDAGLAGLGEAAPLPEFGGGTAEDAERRLAEIAPSLTGLDINALPGRLAAFPPALRCALDVAALDVLARARRQPLAALLAAEYASTVPVNATIGAAALDGAVAAARRAVEAGFGTVKLKVGVAASPEAEEARVAAVRAAIGPDTRLRLDANGAWAPDAAVAIIQRLDPYDLELIEQPVPAGDLDGLARVRRAVDAPIAADEAVTSDAAAQRIIEVGAADALVIKPMVVGGPRAARRIIDLADEAGLRALVTTSIDTGIGIAAALHLAATLPAPPLACGLATAELLETDLLVRPLVVREGRMPLPEGPGLGVEVDEETLRTLRRRCDAGREGAGRARGEPPRSQARPPAGG